LRPDILKADIMKSLATYWSTLRGSVHPEDEATFADNPEHGFDLSFPPPAFIGDVENAPIIILDNNGGFDPTVTPGEFRTMGATDGFRDDLASSAVVDPRAPWVSPYYCQRNFTKWLVSGEAALVNGVAYRSVSGREKSVARLSKVLPSAIFHRRWLIETVLPSVDRGERFLIVHRWSRWGNVAGTLKGRAGTIHSNAPISKELTAEEVSAGTAFLHGR
jgi:hypothetical protein